MADNDFKIKKGLNVANGRFIVNETEITIDGVGVITQTELDTETAARIASDVTIQTNIDDAVSNGIDTLTTGEVDQLKNINTTTVSTTQWGYVGVLDQGLGSTDAVTFNQVTTDTINSVSDTVTVSENLIASDSLGAGPDAINEWGDPSTGQIVGTHNTTISGEIGNNYMFVAAQFETGWTIYQEFVVHATIDNEFEMYLTNASTSYDDSFFVNLEPNDPQIALTASKDTTNGIGVKFRPNIAEATNANVHYLNTYTTYTDATVRILRIENNGSELLTVNPQGDLNITGNFEIDDNVVVDQAVTLASTPSFSGLSSLSKSGDSSDSVMIGASAGNASMTGDYNFLSGVDAGLNITSGYSNFAVGLNAMKFNVTGFSNIVIGEDAGTGSTSQSYSACIYMGQNSGNAATSGNNNVAIGFETLLYDQSGTFNVAIGYRAGSGVSDESSSQNIFIGSDSGYLVGTGALNNVGIGQNALRIISSGTNNTAIGTSAGNNVTTGSNNIFIGVGARASVAGATNQCVIGGTGGNVVKVGLGGQNDPQESLDVIGNILATGQITGAEPWEIHTTTAGNEGITGVVNRRYMADTTLSTANITLTMPSASLGDVVTVTDMKNNFIPAGSKNVVTNSITFEGATTTFEFDVANSTTQLVYTGASYGWKAIITQP